ncbi:pyridoxal-5'-phosphate-dependent enzyme, beta family protein [Paraphysoderma sedebokerense]|nr:pyridoxal-5'-phosphate-dependent enzyme, beta family protein [Paraphysoderma sedebokerense]
MSALESLRNFNLPPSLAKSVPFFCLSIASGFLLVTSLTKSYRRSRAKKRIKSTERDEVIADGVVGLIGNTPLIRIKSLSDYTGCEILAKAEFLNPGGSSKDRVALSIITTAEQSGLIKPHCNCTIFEGTVGSTGISLAMICRAKGYNCHIVMPDDVAIDKVQMLERFGAVVERVKPVSIIDKNQFVNVAKRRAEEYTDYWKEREKVMMKEREGQNGVNGYTSGNCQRNGDTEEWFTPTGFFADQFENLANYQIHYETTGPEIFNQTKGELDAFVMGAGTGGTIAGVTRYLKERLPNVKAILCDPPGSGLYHKVKHNIFYAPTEAEGTRRRHQIDTIIEGIGINRLTSNFERVCSPAPSSVSNNSRYSYIDDAIRVTDEEAVKMSRFLLLNDGIFIGSSSAVNCVAAVKVAKKMGEGKRIVTILCDGGVRHLGKFWNDEFIASQGINPSAASLDEFIS